MSMMLKDAAADDVTFGQWKISQLCSNLKETIDRSVDVGDKKQKNWLSYCPDPGIAPHWDRGSKPVTLITTNTQGG